MTNSIIFQIIGLTYLALGLGLLMAPSFYQAMIDKMLANEAMLFIMGFLVLLIGYFLVIYHNFWTGGLTVIITIFGWLALLKGLMMIIFPKKSIKLYKTVKISQKQLGIYGVVVLALGAIITYLGCLIFK